MAIRRTDIEIILPGVTYQEKMAIPVWDAYIEKVVIDGGYSFPDIRQVMWRDKVYDKWLSSKIQWTTQR